ncbi:MAG: hypothetical protein RI894_944 [Bacteroidota bacterium]|jgi:glycosidase
MRKYLTKRFLTPLIWLGLIGNYGFAQANFSETKSSTDPNWAKKVVWYQVFPERFRNGDPTNDPTLLDTYGSYPYDSLSPWQIHTWGADWYQLQPYEKKNSYDIWKNISRRRYGGDLQGVIDKLDYLKDLGISAIYMNPIFMSPSLHKYDAICYHHVDPTFGPDPVGDKIMMLSETPDDPTTWQWTKADLLALKLIKECHARNIYIVFDGVFNHLGWKSFAFKDVEKNQAASKYKNWFDIQSFANAATGTKFEYKGWWGVKDLPEIKEDENGIVAEPKQYIFDITKRWMDPNGDGNPSEGIDGWRLDVAFCIGHPFWKDWHKLVRSINKNAYTTAEIMDDVPKLKEYVRPDEFNGLMNYNFQFISSEFFISEKNRISPSVFDSLMERQRNAFPYTSVLQLQNLFDSHDTDRLGSRIVNRDKRPFLQWQKWFDESHGRDVAFDTRKPTFAEYEMQKLMTVFQMTYPGAPMIYYGDEAGIWGANDPDCRKPMLWTDITYQPESTLPNQRSKAQIDEVSVNKDLFAFYKKLINIRNKHTALQLGEYKTILLDNPRQLFGFMRNYSNSNIYIVFNNSNRLQGATLDIPANVRYRELLSGKLYPAIKSDAYVEQQLFGISPHSAIILIDDAE